MSYIGNSPGVASQRIVTSFTATSGQTLFTLSSGYSLGYLDVFLNGVKLSNSGSDYIATNGTSMTLTQAAASGDIVECVAYLPRGLSDGYLKSEADARYLSSTNGSVTQAKLAAGVSGNGPAFSAYSGALQAVSSNTVTKVLFGVETYDTNNNFASSRFTPTVAGYYAFTAGVKITANGWFEMMLYKNNVLAKTLFYSWPSSVQLATGGCQLYMNGSTDFVEIYIRQANNTNVEVNADSSYFDGALIRSAT